MIQITKPKERAKMANANDYLLDACFAEDSSPDPIKYVLKILSDQNRLCNRTKSKNLYPGSASPLMLTVHLGGRDILRKRGERRETGYSMTIWRTTVCVPQHYSGLGTIYSLSILFILRILYATLSPSVKMSWMKKGVSP